MAKRKDMKRESNKSKTVKGEIEKKLRRGIPLLQLTFIVSLNSSFKEFKI